MKIDVYNKKDELINRSVKEKLIHLFPFVGFLLFFVVLSHTSVAQISGVVYRDFNEDGVRSYTATYSGELGVGGVTVNIYNSAGLIGTTSTSSATATLGSYSITPSSAGPYRVEFVNLPTGYFDGTQGSGSGTSVQFVSTAPATVNLGINYPSDYCQSNPNFFVPCYVNGNSLGAGNAASQGVLVTLPYSSTGDSPSESAIATNVQIGTVYGVAYQRTAQTIFTSAFVKRHSGLGSGGAGAIYVTIPGSGTTYTSKLFATLPSAISAVSPTTIGGTTVVGSNTDRGLPDATTTLNHDQNTFDQVGKAGIGDIELSEDGTQLYAVNLGDRKLYQIPVTNANTTNPTANTTAITSYSLPTITQATGSVFRPFALKSYRGLIYIGGVTTNEAVSTTISSGTGSTGGTTPLVTRDTTGMRAIVYAFDPATSTFTQVLSFPLTYRKGATGNDQNGVSRADRWFPWVSAQPSTNTVTTRYARNDLPNASHPQPILAGIEFDVDGSMILSIRDRFGDQYGNNNYGTNTSDNSTLYRAIAPGDILRAGLCTAGSDQWTIENNARVCSGTATLGTNTNQGPGGGEYYYADAVPVGFTQNNVFVPYHAEMSEGGLALLPGRNEVASTALDPTDNIDSGGIRRFKNSDGSGSPSTSVQIYRSGDVGTYGKANGLGDIEIDCDLPPIQIGNRVFRDTNGNGIQDPGEPGISGIQVVLRGPNSTVIAIATTNANGEYYFSTSSTTSTTSSVTNLSLTAGTSYTLSFPTSLSSALTLTTTNASSGSNSDAVDSDPSAAGFVAFVLGSAGQNNFTYDAGYSCIPPTVTLSSATICAGQSATLVATSGFTSYSYSTGLTPVTNQPNAASITTTTTATSSTTPYSVTVTNALGCSAVATGSVIVNSLPAVTLSSATVCAGQTATLTATAGLATYAFSAGLTRVGQTNTATITTSTTVVTTTTTPYSVTVTNTAGCSAVATGLVTVNPNPVATLSSATVCAGQTATLTATSGFSSYAFSAGLNQTSQANVATITTLSTAPAGTTPYSVTVTNANGCSAVANGSITINALPVVTLSSATVCAGQSATLTATAGFNAYAFSTGLTRIGQTNAATLTTLSTASASTTPYSVTVTNANGCSAITTGSVTVNPNPVVTLGSVTVCAGQTATLTATDGFSSYAFSAGLNQVAGQTNTATLATSATVTTTTTTPYAVTVTSAAGCSAVTTGSVTINPNPVVTLSSATVCAGQSATLTATAGFNAYAFSTGLTQTGQANVATLATSATASASTAPYSVTVTNTNGCSAVTTGSVTINAVPVVTLNAVTVCAGQTATLRATNGFSSYVFSAGLNQVVGQTNTATITTPITVATTTTTPYSVTVTNATGCSAVATGSVTVNPIPVVTLSSVTVCAGQTATLTATPGLSSYAFSTGLNQVVGQTNTATLTTLATASASTTPYSVTVTNANGCSAVASGSITINAVPVVTLSSVTVCASQTATLTATGGFSSYAFSDGLNQVVGQTNTATLTTLATASASTTPYSVTVTNANGCSAVASGSITINAVPVVTLSSVTVCAGQTATLTATGGFTSYKFTTGLNQVVGQTNTATLATAATAANSTTPYAVTVTNANGCSAVATGSVTINATPAVTLSSVTVCAGQTATLTATPGFSSYAFSTGLNQVVGQTNTATLATSAAITTASTTPYAVTVTNANGCSAVTTGSVTVNPNPVVTLSSATVCAGQTATLTATGGFSSYAFSAGLTQAVGQTNTATLATSATITTASTTPYSVTVTNATGCSAVTTGSITINPVPVATLSSVTICAGQTATLRATNGFSSYVFSAGLTQVAQGNTATITPSATAAASTTPYAVTVTNANGCSAVATGSVTINATPAVTLSSVTVCAGQTATLTATSGFSSYAFSTGLNQVVGQTNTATLATSAAITTATTTSYSVTVTNGTGCSAVATGSVTVNPNPVVTLSSATVCAGQTATLTATAGFSSYVFSAGLTQTGQINTATLTTLTTASGATTPYSVTVTNAAGCSAVATGSVTVNPLPTASLSSVTLCTGQTAVLTAPSGYATYQFSAGLTQVAGQPNTATTTTAGTYSVIITSAAGCSSTAVGSVTYNNTPVVTLSSVTVCAGQTATLTATGGFSSYVFSTGLTPVAGQPNVATAATAGTYSVTATSNASCVGSATATVTITPNPVVTLSSATVCAGQTATLTTTPGFSSYVFSAGLNQVVGQNNTATLATSASATASTTTPYSVTVTNAAGCSAVTTGSITINPNPVVTLSSATVCAGQTATLTATPGFSSYVFSAGLNQVVGQTNTAAITTPTTVAAAATTPYAVTVTNANGCSAVTTGSVTVNPNPVVTLSTVTVCAGQTATLRATNGFSSYVFSPGLTLSATQANVTTITTLATAAASTTPYAVTVTNAAGCSAVATGSVTVNPTPVVSLNSVTICAGQTATLTASPGFAAYQFSTDLTPATGQANVATLATLATAANSTTPYAVTVTNANGCSAVTTGSVTINLNPVVTLSSVTVCAGQTATLTATDGLASYAFSAGLNEVVGQTNTATLTTAAASTTPYSVTVTNANGCSAVATGSVTVNPNPVVTLSSATVCAGQSATLTATAGFNAYAFSTGLTRIGQTNAATLTTLATAANSTTPYSVTVTNANGCSAVTTGSVTVNSNPVVILSSVTVCAGQTATLTATDGFSSYAFTTGLNQVSGQANVVTLATSATINTATTTPYSVTVSTTGGCSAVATGSVTINPNPVVTLSSATICAGQTATLTATGGFSSYAFSTGLTEVVGQTNTATLTTLSTLASASTTPYSVTVTNAAGCSAVATGSITVNPNPVVTLSSVTVCAGQTATLRATNGYSSYVFSPELTLSATQANVATITPSATAAGTTPYSVTVTSAAGCSVVASGSVTVNATPSVTLSSVTVCAGQTASLTATPGFGSYVFSAGLNQAVGQTNTATITTLSTASASTTPYSVTVTSGSGCSAVATGSVTVNPNPVVTLGSTTVCAGQTAILTATPGFVAYQFSTDLTPATGQANVATLVTLGTASATTTPYSVTVTNTAGCSAVATGSVTVNPVPVVTLSSVTVCAGQTATLTATPGFAAYQFSASLNQVAGQNNTATFVTSATATNSTTPYSVTVTNTNGCSAVATGSVTINSNPAVTLSSVTMCAGQTASLTATPGFGSYAFSTGLNQVVGQTNTATITTLATASASTTPYSVTVSSGVGCSAVATGSVTVNPNPVVTLSSVTVCAGQSATLTATAGLAAYQFSADLSPATGQANVATITTLTTALATTTPYSVTVTNATGCSAVATGSVTVNPNPVVTLSSVTVCAGQTASLTATAGFNSYGFSAGLRQVVGQINTATLTAPTAITTVTTIPYSVTVTNINGCSAVATGSITVNPTPVVTLSSATICAGQTATLSATSGFAAYQFSAGLTQLGSSNLAVATTNGFYSVTVTDVNGCSATASATVTVNPNPVLALSSATVCAGQSTTLTATPGFASYSFSAGLTAVAGQPNVATGTSEGIYSVTVTNDTGCSNTATGTITVNPNPSLAFSSATICSGQTVSLTATPGYSTYQFSAGLTPVAGQLNAATGSVPGIYSVTATSAAGCSATATGSITISPNVVVALSSATICSGQTGVLTATAGYTTYIFSPGLTQVGSSNVASTTVAGTYSVTALNSIGCSGTATATLVVNPTAVVALSSATICAGQSATLTATAGFSNYVFSAGLTPVPGTPNAAVGTVAGTYSVTAISSASCSGSATGSITVNPAVVASLTVSSATLCQGQSATLTASGGNTYLWSTNERTPSIVVTTSGVYSVTVISTSGCTDVASSTITVNPLPVLTINSATICSGQSASLTVGGCDGGTVLWSNGANTATILVSPTVPTTYSVLCTFPTGCSSTIATGVNVSTAPSYTTLPQAFTASCTGATANNDARILLTGLQNTERIDIVLGSIYGNGPAYGAPTNVAVSRGIGGFINLPNPVSSQPYTIRLFNVGGTCYTDVTVILEPAFCNCPPAKCVPFVIRKTQTGRTAIR